MVGLHLLKGYNLCITYMVGTQNLPKVPPVKNTHIIFLMQHEDFGVVGNVAGYPDDIGVLELSSSLSLNADVAAIPMDTRTDYNNLHSDCSISGWGQTCTGQ